MTITLAQVAKLTTDPLRKGIVMNILRYAKVMERLPFTNVNSLTSVAVRWTKLPTVAFRRINADYTANDGDVEQVYESVYAFGGTVSGADRVFKKIGGSLIQDPQVMNVTMKTMAMALYFNDYLINGDHASDPDGFEGLKKRLSNGPTRQVIRAGGSTDVLDPTASAANARRFLDKMEEAWYKAGGGMASPNVILCNEGMSWGLGRVLRFLGASAAGLLDTGKDSFDREFVTYKGAAIVDMGLKADQTTEIIPHNETADDAGADATSMYFVPFDEENGLVGIQLGDMETFEGVKTMNTAENPTVVEWWVGLLGLGSYGASRLYNIETPDNWT